MTVAAAILDSGHVLIRPPGGEWLPGELFDRVCDAAHPGWDRTDLARAHAEAHRWLDEVHAIPLADESAEEVVFAEYYRRVLGGVGLPPELADAIIEAKRTYVRGEVFEWTREVLAGFAERDLPVVICSDSWPSLRRTYRALDLERHVRGMVISAELGCTKPDPRMYAAALELAGVRAADALFVDDSPGCVRGAMAVGMRAVRLRLPGADPDAALDEITDLREVFSRL